MHQLEALNGQYDDAATPKDTIKVCPSYDTSSVLCDLGSRSPASIAHLAVTEVPSGAGLEVSRPVWSVTRAVDVQVIRGAGGGGGLR